MERLWAPWRTTYINAPATEGCFLCEAWKGTDDRAARVVYRGRLAFVVMNLYPYNNGHLLVAPARHAAELRDLGQEESLELMDLLSRSVETLRRCLNPDGFNIGINLGKVAGAGLPGHLHLHVVPRWSGDTNFMPVIGELKVISEHLEATYGKVIESFR